jgi:hypothetical protein
MRYSPRAVACANSRPKRTGAAALRLVELLGAVSLATDVGTGQPHFHGVRTSVLAAGLGRGLGGHAVAEVQRLALLWFLGCTSDSRATASGRCAGRRWWPASCSIPVVRGTRTTAC